PLEVRLVDRLPVVQEAEPRHQVLDVEPETVPREDRRVGPAAGLFGRAAHLLQPAEPGREIPGAASAPHDDLVAVPAPPGKRSRLATPDQHREESSPHHRRQREREPSLHVASPSRCSTASPSLARLMPGPSRRPSPWCCPSRPPFPAEPFSLAPTSLDVLRLAAAVLTLLISFMRASVRFGS